MDSVSDQVRDPGRPLPMPFPMKASEPFRTDDAAATAPTGQTRKQAHATDHQPVTTPDRRLYDGMRLVIDTLLAAVALVVLAIPMLALAAIVRLDSPGKPFFWQQRIGRNGRRFKIVKLRTMYVTAPRYSLKVRSHDDRVTRVGRVLRRTGLDELPQLWNVLRTEMRLIGPRPELPFIVETYEPWQHERHAVAPGISGWWQVHHRDEVPMHLNTDYDLYYVRHRSFALDLKIVWLTLIVFLKAVRNIPGRGAPSFAAPAPTAAADEGVLSRV